MKIALKVNLRFTLLVRRSADNDLSKSNLKNFTKTIPKPRMNLYNASLDWLTLRKLPAVSQSIQILSKLQVSLSMAGRFFFFPEKKPRCRSRCQWRGFLFFSKKKTAAAFGEQRRLSWLRHEFKVSAAWHCLTPSPHHRCYHDRFWYRHVFSIFHRLIDEIL